MSDTLGRGLIVVQVDGMSRHALEALVEAGRMPNMGSLLSEGTLRLTSWTPLRPPCTPASQAGILFGINDDIPGFRWLEKPTGRLMVANHAGDAAELEQRLSTEDGLLARKGVSVGNLLSGDAPSSHLTMATMDRARQLRLPGSGYPVDPRAWLRIGSGMIVELIDELVGAHRQRRDHVRPRMRRGFRFVIERIVTNVPLRILSTSMVIHELRQGRPIVYVDFTGYDAISHHTGPERPDGYGAANRIDRSIGHILGATALTDRQYDLVVLSDHGQSLGPTFRQRYGSTLVQVVAGHMGDGTTFDDGEQTSEYGDGPGRLRHHLLGHRVAAAIDGLSQRRRGSRGHRLSRIIDGRGAPLAAPADADIGDVVVCASGNLGLIYLTSVPGRMTREGIKTRYPGLVGALVAHPGIGLLVLHSDQGLVAVGRGGTHLLDRGIVVGDDPVAVYGPMAVDGLRRVGGFEHSGDIIALGTYDAERDQVISFEELVGSHGGLGGHQDDAFIAYPGRWTLGPEPLTGAPAIHRQLRRWLAETADPAAEDDAATNAPRDWGRLACEGPDREGAVLGRRSGRLPG